MTRCFTALKVLAVVLSSAGVGNATIIGFGQIGGSNTAIAGDLASNAVADGPGYVVSNGATPNVSLTWDAAWDIHTSGHFSELEDHTVGGGDWDNEGGGPRIAQLDSQSHTIGFAADSGYAVVLNSFDFANTAETVDSATWDLVLTDDATNGAVWSQTVTLANPDDDVVTVTPAFTGADGGSYTLSFVQTDTNYTLNGRHGVDNLSFNQVAIPEPTAAALAAFGVLAALRGRGRC